MKVAQKRINIESGESSDDSEASSDNNSAPDGEDGNPEHWLEILDMERVGLGTWISAL